MLPLIPSLQATSDATSIFGGVSSFGSQTALSPFGGALTAGSTDSASAGFGSFGAAFQSAAGLAPGLAPGLTSSLAPVGATTGTSAPFSDLLVQSVTQVDQLERAAQTSIEGLLSGKGVDVHEAMISTEKAEMGFDMAVAVRDKAISAYQQVMGMQF